MAERTRTQTRTDNRRDGDRRPPRKDDDRGPRWTNEERKAHEGTAQKGVSQLKDLIAKHGLVKVLNSKKGSEFIEQLRSMVLARQVAQSAYGHWGEVWCDVVGCFYPGQEVSIAALLRKGVAKGYKSTEPQFKDLERVLRDGCTPEEYEALVVEVDAGIRPAPEGNFEAALRFKNWARDVVRRCKPRTPGAPAGDLDLDDDVPSADGDDLDLDDDVPSADGDDLDLDEPATGDELDDVQIDQPDPHTDPAAFRVALEPLLKGNDSLKASRAKTVLGYLAKNPDKFAKTVSQSQKWELLK